MTPHPTLTLSLLIVLLTSAQSSSAEETARDLSELNLTVRLAEHELELALVTQSPLTVSHSRGNETFEPGPWIVRLVHATPATTQYRVFGKTFTPAEENLAADYMNLWSDKDYVMERITLGSRYKAPSGAILDTRIYWISFGCFPTATQAQALQKKLDAESVWAWIREERHHEGRGIVALVHGSGENQAQWDLPVVISAHEPLLLKRVNTGYWKEKRVEQAFSGDLALRVDDEARLEIIETISLDDYLEGVLPAEMPAEWPLEALKAQAVAARSEIIFNASKTHTLEGFDFCALEHCRAYGPHSARAQTTHAAIAATHGEVITHNGLVVPTVFSADCGGWTEDNDSVWSGPLNPVLRAKADFPEAAAPDPRPSTPPAAEHWLTSSPAAFCSIDDTWFRWRVEQSGAELTQNVNKQHAIGPVSDITLGERARGGRLKWVTITGRDGSVTVRKELPIRLAFGGLPSAMFMVRINPSPEGLRSVEFVGGGRGHGVGLCQQGARGMAVQGYTYIDILQHYFTGIRVERYRDGS